MRAKNLIVAVVYTELISGSTYELNADFEESQYQCMKPLRFQSYTPSALQLSRESREHALKHYQLFFSNPPNDQPNMYFNLDIGTCYMALSDPFTVHSIGLITRYVGPSDGFSNDHSWNLLCSGIARLGCQNDLPDFPVAKYMAVDAHFLKVRPVLEDWKSFFKYVPSVESFTFFHDGNARLLRRGRHVRGRELRRLWGSLSDHSSVAVSKFLE